MIAWMNELFSSFADSVIAILPLSPFKAIINSWSVNSEWLSYLNWFFPVGGVLTILAAWLSAYVLYLLASIVLRWIKAVK